MVAVEISGKLPTDISADIVQKLADLSVKIGGGSKRVSVSVALVGDSEIRRLNRLWRGVDKVTDVLSFAHDEGAAAAFSDPSAKVRPLGDIVIALPQVRRQARSIGRPVRQELSLMIVHGLLHLLGFDHDTVRKETTMFGLQQEVLMRAGVL